MTHRMAARVVGTLFIVATVPFSLAVVLLAPVLGAPDYLTEVSLHELQVAAGVLLELTNHIAVVGIAVVIYPVLRPFSERLAVAYIAARSIESVIFIIGTMHLAALLHVSQEFVAAGAPAGSQFHTLGTMLLAGHDWDRAEFAFIAFSLSALILNYLLFRARLVPRWLCGWGLLGAALILTARILVILGLDLPSSTVTLMDTPIMVQEMVFAVWLIVKGFNPAAFLEGPEPAA
jgi:hypothetical protein